MRMGAGVAQSVYTRYGLVSPWIESRWGGARFSAPFQNGSEAHPASYTMGTGSFRWVKRPGRGVDYPPSSSAEFKERVELYFYSPSALSWLRANFTVTFTCLRMSNIHT